MNVETKAGIVTIIGIAALLASVVFLRGGLALRRQGYELHMVLGSAGGIALGAPVQMAGIDVGRVERVHLTDTLQAQVTMRIRPGTTIPTGSRFAIASSGLLGDRLVAILPGPPAALPIAPGTVVAGTDPLTVDQLFERVTNLARQAEEALTSINRLIGDPGLAAGLLDTVSEARDATRSVRRSAESIERTTAALERSLATEAPVVARRLTEMAAGLAQTAADVASIVKDVNAEGKTAAQIRATVASIERAAAGIEKMVKDLSGVINEQEVKAVRVSLEEARKTVTEAREAVVEARGMIGRADRVVERVSRVVPDRLEIPDLRTSYRLEYSLIYDGSRLGHDVIFSLLPEAHRSYHVTWREMGGGNRLGLQIGQRLNERLTLRYGLLDSHLGGALDYSAWPSTAYTMELYNISQLTLNLQARYFLRPEYGITLRLHSVFFEPTVGVGLFRRF